MKVIIFGTWQFGTAIKNLVGENWHDVVTWSLRGASDLKLLPEADFYISTLNASGVEKFSKEISVIVAWKPILSVTKAFVHTDDIFDIFPTRLLWETSFVLSWPNLASEMLLWLPTGATIWWTLEQFILTQSVLQTSKFHLQHFPEVRVIELMWIMKNIIAIWIWIIDGFWLGENMKWIFITHMCNDTMFFAKQQFNIDFNITNIYAGIGDIFTTCSSNESRNHWFGVYFARTTSIQRALDFMNTSIEWLQSIRVLWSFCPVDSIYLYRFLSFFQWDGASLNKDAFIKSLF